MKEQKKLKITRVEIQKHNVHRYSIYLDEEYSFSVGEDVLVKYSLLKGTELEESFIEDVLLEEEKSKALNTALRYLGYRMRSKKEVADKLEEKGYSDLVEKVMTYLEENNYVDDAEFAVCFAKDKFALSGFGQNRIRMELVKKGINSVDIDRAIEELFDSDMERESVKELAIKKLSGSYRNDNYESKYRKTSAYLYRKGYSAETIRSVLKELL